MKYLIGSLPNHTVVFEYGERLTQNRKDKASEVLLDFVKENYELPEEHLTLERSKQTIDNELRFGQYNNFEQTEDGYKTENSTSVNHQKEIVTFNIEQ